MATKRTALATVNGSKLPLPASKNAPVAPAIEIVKRKAEEQEQPEVKRKAAVVAASSLSKPT